MHLGKKKRDPFWGSVPVARARSVGVEREGDFGEVTELPLRAAAVEGGLFTFQAPLITAINPKFNDFINQHPAVPRYLGVPVNFNLGLYPICKTFPCIKQRFHFLITSQRRSFALGSCYAAHVKSPKKEG